MNQEKIGKFIAKVRKEKNMTQQELAKKLNITDRAISHWENGRSMPDAGIMLELCKLLDINVNELLSAKKIIKESYNEQAEENLLEMRREIESKNKKILILNRIITFLGVVIYLLIVLSTILIEMPMEIRNTIMALALVMLLLFGVYNLNIIRKTGYYECQECKHQYIPTFNQMFFGISGITKGGIWRMKCPNCNKKCWHKKVLTKNKQS
ncbi:MAG: helix-turn-helix transcriptional regulator [Bacilli bacterium]|nr:helix-turn-helix transcriptional regulator [Bacilli bacterium]MBQ7240958.1 helix-turn-helix transcriptional regulator [Bacilli bacterium]